MYNPYFYVFLKEISMFYTKKEQKRGSEYLKQARSEYAARKISREELKALRLQCFGVTDCVEARYAYVK
jgi:hypothetical protein